MASNLKRASALRWSHWLLVLSVSGWSVGLSSAQTFNSGSTGADGDLIINAPGVTTFTLTPQGGGSIYNFKGINIAAGSTLKISGASLSGPVYFLAQNAVTISGTLDLSGANGQFVTIPANRQPTAPGAGGFSGGVGSLGSNLPQPGNGPGGGAIGVFVNCSNENTYSGTGGLFTGNQYLVPLIGGSGGGGTQNSFSGGAGGGAILIASSVSIAVTGSIIAAGGTAYVAGQLGFSGNSGGGSGGAIRLVSNLIAGNGSLNVAGGTSGQVNCNVNFGGGNGVIRLEAFQNSYTGALIGPTYLA